MPDFLVSMIDGRGKRVIVKAEGTNAHDAAARLVAEGWGNVTLLTDDTMAALVSFEVIDKGQIAPAEMARLIGVSNAGSLWRTVGIVYKRLSKTVLLCLMIGLGSWGTMKSWLVLEIVLTLLAVPLIYIAALHLFGRGAKANRLMEDFYWGRWQKVLDMASQLRAGSPPKQQFDLDMREATALAVLGRVDEALALAGRHERSGTVPHWMYLVRMSELYRFSKQEGRALDCMEEAYLEAPDNSTIQLGLAKELALLERTPDRARRLIDDLEGRHLCIYVRDAILNTRGLLALNARQWREAQRLLLEFDGRVKPLAGSTAFGYLADGNHALLAIAYARLQERDEAERHWKKAEPRMKALNATRMIDRYAAALAGR